VFEASRVEKGQRLSCLMHVARTAHSQKIRAYHIVLVAAHPDSPALCCRAPQPVLVTQTTAAPLEGWLEATVTAWLEIKLQIALEITLKITAQITIQITIWI
jgi:hypothetical protein